MESSRLAILIPAYNEEVTIKGVVQDLASDFSVFVFDDGSSDNTADLARAGGAGVLTSKQNIGYDHAIWQGLTYLRSAGYRWVVICDADGQHRSSDVRRIAHALFSSQAEVVVGVRRKTARLAEKLFAIHASRAHGVDDPLCGLKGFRMSETVLMDKRSFLGSVGTGIAISESRHGALVLNLSISESQRANGQSRFAGPFRANLRIFRALFKCFGQDLAIGSRGLPREKRVRA